MIKITKEQKDMLWWENWPYSEAKLIFETRILDNQISRRFMTVEVIINPTTYKICKDNIEKFSSNPMISQLLEHSEDRWKQHWYISMAFSLLYNLYFSECHILKNGSPTIKPNKKPNL